MPSVLTKSHLYVDINFLVLVVPVSISTLSRDPLANDGYPTL